MAERVGRAVVVAARGWDHPGWAGSYYPVDLPESWRLAYYANEFSAVLVPATRWMPPAVGGPAAWLAEVPEDFRFHLELDAALLARAGTESGELQQRLGLLGAQLGGVVLRPGRPGQSPLLRPGASWLGCPVSDLDLLPSLPRELPPELGSTEALAPVWWSGGEEWAYTPAGVKYGIIEAGDALSPRALRTQAERFRDAGGATLVFDGRPPSIDNLRQMAIVLDLLG